VTHEKKKRNKKSKRTDQFDSDEDQLPQNESIVVEGTIEDAPPSVEEKTRPSSHHQNEWDENFDPLRNLLGESFYEDEDSSEDEGMPDYKIGGYHPIHVGEILMDRYVII